MLVVSCLQRNLEDVDSINHIVVSCKPCKVRDVEAGVFSTGLVCTFDYFVTGCYIV